MLRWVTLLALTAALTPACVHAAVPTDGTPRSASPPRATSTVPVPSTNVALDATEYVASRSGDIACATPEEWSALTTKWGMPASSTGMTWVNAGRVRYAPWVCVTLARGASDPMLGAALNTVAHEGAHLGGTRDEATAACVGLQRAPELAIRYYGIRPYTTAGRRVIASSLWLHAHLPALYHTAGCG